jgi:hypothetical protein
MTTMTVQHPTTCKGDAETYDPDCPVCMDLMWSDEYATWADGTAGQ